jgi:NAD(P)-dependent dehydrogenase (short-subunit alcohol dehydrogenase family)
VCDVAQGESVRTAVARAVEQLGRLDVLVNAAGVGGFARFEEISEAEYQRTMGINVGGAFHTMQAAMPHLLGRPGANVVNVASTSAMRGTAYAAVYSASKGALVNLTRSVALEFASRGLRANCISPGAVRTPFGRFFLRREDFEQNLIDYSRPPVVGAVAEPDDIAGPILFLASDDAKTINGAVLLADMGTLA